MTDFVLITVDVLVLVLICGDLLLYSKWVKFLVLVVVEVMLI